MFTSTLTRKAPVQTVSDSDAAYVAAWGLTAWEWAIATDAERVTYRDRVAFAPNFSTEGN